MKPVETVGILGLGKMGCPIAGHLVAKGFKVVGYDPLEEARSRAVALGARAAASAREAARASDLVIVVVGFDSEVEEVLFGREGVLEGARPGLIVALGSTVAPRYSARLAVRLAERNLVLLDIPLARGETAATAGKLLVYGAGDPDAFELCRPVFGAFASDVFHLGPAGAGQVAKMVNNLILWACIAVNDEGLRLRRALGGGPERLCEALRRGRGPNRALGTPAHRSGLAPAGKDKSILPAVAG